MKRASPTDTKNCENDKQQMYMDDAYIVSVLKFFVHNDTIMLTMDREGKSLLQMSANIGNK